MTIKQQGGVFGRHPSFSTLEVDGQSTLGPVSAENAGTALTAKRTGSEGEIAAWYKDSTKVAGLNVLSGDAWLNVPDRAGLRFSGTGIVPLKNGAVSDAQISLGSPIYRFNSLYMSGNVVIGINSGIDFSATSGTGTSELFDDYEEGTFTPNLLFGGSNTGMTYSSQAGLYTKIGNAVVFSIRIILTAKGSSTGDASISGLPFAAGSTFRGNFSVFYQSVNIDTAGGYYTFCAQPNPSNTTLTLREVGDNISAAAITSSDFSDTSLIDICGTYRT